MSALARPVDLLRRLQDSLASIADFSLVRKSQTTVRTRLEVERIVMLSIVGELSGVFVAPPQLVLGLLPFLVPSVFQWRRRVYGFADLSGNAPISC